MQETQDMWIRSLDWEDPLEEEMATHSIILTWKNPMDKGAWRAAVYGVEKSRTWLSAHSGTHWHLINTIWMVIKNLPANAGDVSLIPWLGRSPGEGNDHPLQYSCLENPVDRGAWKATVHGVEKESDTVDWVAEHACTHTLSSYDWSLFCLPLPQNLCSSGYLLLLQFVPKIPCGVLHIFHLLLWPQLN